MFTFIALIAVGLFVYGLVTGKGGKDEHENECINYEISKSMNPEGHLYDSTFRH